MFIANALDLNWPLKDQGSIFGQSHWERVDYGDDKSFFGDNFFVDKSSPDQFVYFYHGCGVTQIVYTEIAIGTIFHAIGTMAYNVLRIVPIIIYLTYRIFHDYFKQKDESDFIIKHKLSIGSVGVGLAAISAAVASIALIIILADPSFLQAVQFFGKMTPWGVGGCYTLALGLSIVSAALLAQKRDRKVSAGEAKAPSERRTFRSIAGERLLQMPREVWRSIANIIRTPFYALGVIFGCIYGLFDPLNGKKVISLFERSWNHEIFLKDRGCAIIGVVGKNFAIEGGGDHLGKHAFYIAACCQPFGKAKLDSKEVRSIGGHSTFKITKRVSYNKTCRHVPVGCKA